MECQLRILWHRQMAQVHQVTKNQIPPRRSRRCGESTSISSLIKSHNELPFILKAIERAAKETNPYARRKHRALYKRNRGISLKLEALEIRRIRY